MKLVLTHDSALQLLRARREHGYENIKPARLGTLDDCACSLRELESFALPFLLDNAQTIHVLAPSSSREYRSKVHACHVMASEIPRGSFYKESEGVYSATPELLFVQRASTVSLIELALFGLELCGTYTLRSDGDFGFSNCPAASTRRRLFSFAQNARPMRGASRAVQALKWVVDGSNSPMESALMLFLCLPVYRGGYGFPLPSLNPREALSAPSVRSLNQETIRCDLHWTDKKVAVEYDSSQEHLKSSTAARDAMRQNALGYEGHTVIRVTPQMVASPVEFDVVAEQLAKALKRRMPRDIYVLSKARLSLRPQLFPWLYQTHYESVGAAD